MNGRAHLPMFLLAFVLAVALKYTVHETEQLSERVVEAPVTYNPQAENMVSYDRVPTVQVGLRGKQSDIALLTAFNVAVVVDIPSGRPGPRDINLRPDNVRAPGDLEVVSLEPNRFTIQVEPEHRSTIRIRAELLGEPAAGARQIEPVVVTPATAQVIGPESHVRAVRELTASVRLDGHARSFTDNVLVVSPDPLVQVVEPTFVEVQVPMEEPELSISFDSLSSESATQ
ncbi:MAG: CdaR family protein [Acidobacteriota bacterium]